MTNASCREGQKQRAQGEQQEQHCWDMRCRGHMLQTPSVSCYTHWTYLIFTVKFVRVIASATDVAPSHWQPLGLQAKPGSGLQTMIPRMQQARTLHDGAYIDASRLSKGVSTAYGDQPALRAATTRTEEWLES